MPDALRNVWYEVQISGLLGYLMRYVTKKLAIDEHCGKLISLDAVVHF